MQLRPLTPDDVEQALAVYSDAVRSQAPGLYDAGQIDAWAGHAQRSQELRRALLRGRGLVSCDDEPGANHASTNRGGANHAGGNPGGGSVEAFGLLDPLDRLSLLYCRGRSSRQGRATALVEGLEAMARAAGYRQLRTEASQLSRPLLLRRGWRVEAEETVLYAAVAFVRWRMIKDLCSGSDG